MPHRPTRDADLLGFGASDLESIVQTFRDIASVEVEDGIIFDPASVEAEEIRQDASPRSVPTRSRVGPGAGLLQGAAGRRP